MECLCQMSLKQSIFDQELTWKAHLKLKVQSVPKQVSALCYVKNSLPVDARYMYYSSVTMNKL